MERKTKITAVDGSQELFITREFDLPVHLLFKAHTDPDLLEQWMGSKAIRLEAQKMGSWQLEKKDDHGQVVFGAHGVFHEFVPDRRIIRTFEMDNAPFDVQLEFFEFEPLPGDSSRLNMQIIYRTVELRDQMLKLPFEYGLNMAHDHLQEVVSHLK
jgi:uncharacterized protein YndB with AHSA1/START domain